MTNKFLLAFSVLSFLTVKSESARILAVLPAPLISHHMVFRVLTRELARRGHEVTVISGVPDYTKDPSLTNYTVIDVSEVLSDIRTKLLTKEIKITNDLVPQFISTFKATSRLVENILELNVIQDLIRKKRNYFDIILLEDCVKQSLIFSHLFNAPAIHISSFGGTFETFEIAGAAIHPFLYPLAVRQRYSNLTLWEKLTELYIEYRLQKAYHAQQMMDVEIFKKYCGINTPTVDELKKNVHMIFLNIHPIWDSNRPVPPNVIYLGGLHQNTQQELPNDLKSALDSSIHGVIYVSFGTNVDSEILSPEKLQIFIEVFSKLPYDIYWKWNDNNLFRLTNNIKIFKWFPQSDLLRHPKVKLFITQGGLQSTDEAIAAGVPLIGIPMMWDQWYNANKYVQLKIGIQLDIITITESKLREAIDTVIKNKSYKENIIKLYSIMRDQMQTPLERAVWWTEHALRNRGADHLRTPSANITWIEYYEIKLILCVIFSSILIILISSLTIITIIRTFVKKTKTD